MSAEATPQTSYGSADSGPPADGFPPSVPQLSRDDLTTMSSDQIVAAKDAGQLDDLLGIT